jgi:hypothetical protein
MRTLLYVVLAALFVAGLLEPKRPLLSILAGAFFVIVLLKRALDRTITVPPP